MNTVLLSIVIPALNEEKYLSNLLGDLQAQTEHNFEIIVVEGTSDDHTRAAALAFATSLPLQVFSVNRRNVSYQRNYGAEKANGPYLLFIDADARVTPLCTKHIAAYIEKEKTAVLLPTLAYPRDKLLYKILFFFTNLCIRVSKLLNKPISAGGCFCVQKKIFMDIGGFNEQLYLSEDHAFIQQAFKNGRKISTMDDVPIVFSLRRLEREGVVTFVYKIVYSFVYLHVKGPIYKKIFAYEMGGKI